MTRSTHIIRVCKMRYWIIFFLCQSMWNAAAQVRIADSLHTELIRHQKGDTTRANIFNELSNQYRLINFNKSLQFAEDALKISEAINYPQGIATACFREAHCYWALGDSERAIEKGLRAAMIAERDNFTSILAEAYGVLAISYRDQQEIEKSISYIRQAEKLAAQEKDWDLLARIYNIAGIVDCTRELNDSAMTFFMKALLVTEEHATSRSHVGPVLSNIGELYIESHPEKALEYFNKALASAQETRNKSAEAGITSDIGRAYTRMHEYNMANEHLAHALKMSRELGLKRVIRHVYYALADLKSREGKTADAFNYMKAYYDVRDSLLNAAQTRQIIALETRFEKEKQQQKIRLLEQEKTIQRIWTNVLVVGSVLLIATLLVIYRLQQQRSAKARQLLETQQALNEKLKEADTLKSRFFANISHEFRTPLSLILGPITEHLHAPSISPEERKKLVMIERNATRLLALVNQLLDLSKLEAGKMELLIKGGNLSAFLQVVTASFDSWAEQKDIAFVKNISSIGVSVGYDADKIEKVVSNLLFNAFKFTPAGGKVVFSFQHYDEHKACIISVTDTGIGISKEEQANVFSPFYQLKNDSEAGHHGTGLGLSLVQELVKLYGGTLSLRSELNEGTCIDVTLPVFPDEGLEKYASAEAAIKENNGLPIIEEEKQTDAQLEERERILIVEDNAELRDFIASGFRRDFNVLLAADGQVGFDIATNQLPDLIISDVMMPKLNGFEFTDKIKSSTTTCHIPVILLTAKADSASRIEGLKTGADDYLAKPFLMDELQVRVSNLLSLRKKLAAKLKEEMTRPMQEASEQKELSLDEKFILKMRSVIEQNIGNSLFGVEMLAHEMSLSRAHLFRKVKALINTTPSEFINDLRLQQAARMIRAKADNVAQIGYAVGFNEQSYFAKRFRKKYGVSPTEYAK